MPAATRNPPKPSRKRQRPSLFWTTLQIQIDNSHAETFPADALAVLCFEAENGKAAAPAVASEITHYPPLAAQSGWLADIRSSGEFTAKTGELALLHRPEGIGAKRLVVAGAGRLEKFLPVDARRAAGALVRALKAKGVRKLALLAREPYTAEEIEALAEGAILGAWEPGAYKSDGNRDEKEI
ncbi:MAG: M17 family peptidase N-terminal domain-containing protein [Bryobacteraceae bacterium]